MEAKHVTLEVRVHGRTVQEYRHNGKTYIEGRKGSDFTLRVRNRGNRRVLAVISVDGLSIMDGKEASYASSGYIVDPFDFVDIPGWRLDLNEAAKFFFSKLGESYAAKMDKPKNVGVIGCAIFCERDTPFYTLTRTPGWHCAGGHSDPLLGRVLRSCSVNQSGDQGAGATYSSASLDVSCQASPQAGGEAPVSCYNVAPEIGTGFGPAVEHRVQQVAFTREAEQPNEVFELHYDTREGLVKAGVDVKKKPAITGPDPFPGQGFCRRPDGWHR